MANLADTINATNALVTTVQTALAAVETQVTALQTAVAAIPTTALTPTIDWATVTTPLTQLQTTASSILAELTPTPPA